MEKRDAWTAIKIIGFLMSIALIIIYIGVLLRDFEEDVRQEETESVVSAMADLSNQGAEMVEKRVGSALNTMEHSARHLKDKEDMQASDVMQQLNRALLDEDTGLNRFGVATPDGTSKVSNGEMIDVSDREYFKSSMKGEPYVSGSAKSRINDVNVFFLSVPVYDVNDNIKGVLYGIIETEQFKVYESAELEKRNQNIYIVDVNGNYISKFLSREAILSQNNFFEDIEERESSISSSRLKKNMEKKTSTYAEITKGQRKCYLYIAPSRIEEWFIVTVINEEAITDKVSNLQGHALDFIINITVLMVVFLIGYFLLISFEKSKTEKINQELRIRDNIFQIATAEMDSLIFLYDSGKDTIEFMNESVAMLGVPKFIEHATKITERYVMPDNVEQIKEFMDDVKKDIKIFEENTEREFEIKKGKRISYYQIKMTHLFDSKKRHIRSIGMIYDVTEKKQKEILLHREEKIRSLFMTDTIAFYEINILDDKVEREGRGQKKITAVYSEALDNFVEKRVVEKYKEMVREKCSIEAMIRSFQERIYDYVVEYEYKRSDETLYWVACEMHLEDDEGTPKAFMTIRDIDSKKRREIHLEKQAVFDALTQLYNRSEGIRKINEALKEMNPTDNSAFLILDLDGFKQINDSLGHMVGDQVLVDVAKIMKSHFRNYDIICRLGGDEFLIFMRRIPMEFLDKIIKSLLKKMVLTYGDEVDNITISASMGVALVPKHGTSFSKLYEKADSALYQVKKTTKNDYMIYKEK